MTCFSPLAAFQSEGGEILFAARGSILRELSLPCGQCVGCRLERSRMWAMRCMHESQLHDLSSFVTLTYSEDNCPVSLRYRDFQLFMKRLRKVYANARFYMCGEYGDRTGRAHFHAILFGVFFADRVVHSESNGFRLYRSEQLAGLWPFGFASIGDVTFESAAYVARYVMKKVTGDRAHSHYQRLDWRTGELIEVLPEFAHMSLKPGIGALWFERFRKDVFGNDRDSVMINGVRCKPPKYYLDYLKRLDGECFEEVEYNRYLRSGKNVEDQTPERLAVRETVAKAKVAFLSRNLE